MKVKDLSGRTHQLSLGQYLGPALGEKSALHEEVREFLRNKYPAADIYEEVYIPGENLRLDFYIHVLRTAIECNGIQHSEQVRFFHPTKLDFEQAKARDRRKAKWCEINNIGLVEFLYNEGPEQWESKLK